MNTRSLLFMVGVSVLLAGVVNAQETPAPNQGNYDMWGSLSVGARMISVNGHKEGNWFQNNAENLFREQYNLSADGKGLGNRFPMSLNLFGTTPGLFDQFSLNAEFNPTVQGGSLKLQRTGSYELNVRYANVDYFFDRYDSLFQGLRRYESNRQDLNAELNVAATDQIGVTLGYRSIGHGGTIQLPRPLYLETPGFEGPDRVFFNVYRNYFLQETPRTDLNTEFSAALNGDFDMFSLTVGGGFINYTEEIELQPASARDNLPLNYRDTRDTAGGFANEFGIVGDLAFPEALRYFFHNEEREMSGPFFFGEAVVTPADIFSLSATFRLESLEGETAVEIGELSEIRRRAGTSPNFRNWNLLMRGSYVGEVKNTLDRMLISAAATLTPMPELDVTAGVRISNHNVESTSEYTARLDTAGLTSLNPTFGSALDSTGQPLHLAWVNTNEQPVTRIFGNLTFAPMLDLTLTAGVTLDQRKPLVNRPEEGHVDSVIAVNMSKETSSLGFNAGFAYRIMPELRLRGRFEMLQREATFGSQSFIAGPSAGTVTDLEPRTTPEDVMRIGASLDWNVMEGLDAGLRFNMQNGKSDLSQSSFVKVNATGTALEMTNDDMGISASFSFVPSEGTMVRLFGETRNRNFSIPVSWTRGGMLPVGGELFDTVDNIPRYQNQVNRSTVILTEETNDLYIDLGVNTRLTDALTGGIGVSFLDVTGYPSVTETMADSAGYRGTPTGHGDVTRTGGPFNRITVNGNIGYDITERFGVLLDVFYAMQKEEELNFDGQNITVAAHNPNTGTGSPLKNISYGFNSYDGLSAALNVVYRF